METPQIGPWAGYDPRDADWMCSFCEFHSTGSHSVCGICNRARLLTDEEKEQIWKSDHCGEELYEKVIACEYFKNNLDAMIDGWRVWNRIPVQVITISKKRYILIAIRSDRSDKDYNLAKGFFSDDFKE